MPLSRDNDGVWTADVTDDDPEGIRSSHPAFLEALPRYMNLLDPAFDRAQRRCEFEFLLSLFRVRGLQDPGWDPYETTLEAIPVLVEAHSKIADPAASRHLELWIYGHILEASEPYELLFNLVEVAGGSHYAWGTNFPPKPSGVPQSPGEKIGRIQQAAEKAGVPSVAKPLCELWDRELRNAIFHADYSVYGGEVRILQPPRTYSHEEIITIVSRAIAYHGALASLYGWYIESYGEPKQIPTSPHFEGPRDLQWVVIVRDGHGAAGVKDAWTPEQIQAGKIPLRIGRFSPNEIEMLNKDPTLARLPQQQSEESRQ